MSEDDGKRENAEEKRQTETELRREASDAEAAAVTKKRNVLTVYVRALAAKPRLAAAVARHLVCALGRNEDSGIEEAAATIVDGLMGDRKTAGQISHLLAMELSGSLVVPTAEQETVCELLSHAVEHRLVPDGDGVRIEFKNREAIREFYEKMLADGDAGIVNAALLFTRCLSGRFSDPVLSRLVEEIARTHHREKYGKEHERQPLLEADVGVAGAFVNALVGPIEHQGIEVRDFKNPDAELNSPESIEARCQRMVRIISLMDARDPSRGLSPRPTELIRGILFSSRFDHVRARRFWEIAAATSDFPVRIFSEPSREKPGPNQDVMPMFSSALIRSFGRFLSVVPDIAVERFGAAMTAASTRWSFIFDQATGVRSAAKIPVPDEERYIVFNSIVQHVERDKSRRDMLLRLFRLL